MPTYDSTSLQSFEIKYLFNELPLSTFGPSNERRLKSSPDLIEGFVSDTTGGYDILNIHNTDTQNAIMIDKLLNYRLGNEVTLDDIVYEEIEYTLAKLIYVYLNLVINGIVTEFDTTTTISSGESLVDSLFEIYVLNESHKLIKTWKNFVASDIIELRPVRKKFIIDQTTLDNGYIFIDSNLPHDTDQMFLYKNGIKQPTTNYSFMNDSTSLTINIDSSGLSGLNIKVDDILVLDSFVSVNNLNPQEQLGI